VEGETLRKVLGVVWDGVEGVSGLLVGHTGGGIDFGDGGLGRRRLKNRLGGNRGARAKKNEGGGKLVAKAVIEKMVRGGGISKTQVSCPFAQGQEKT